MVRCAIIALLFVCGMESFAQNVPENESKYYKITTVPVPDSIMLEVGGLAFTDEDKLGVATRRGEIWVIDDPYQANSKLPRYSLFASGLHEPLWLAYKKGAFFTTQRSELTKMSDSNGDGSADLFQTIYSWPISGNYHEYSYGPLILPNGEMLVTLNLSWVGRGESLTKWRGWMLKITEDGKMTPFATGMRSPAAFGLNASGDIFVAENQGDWIGSGRITHLNAGDFAGHPAGLKWASEPGSPLDLKRASFADSIGIMYDYAQGKPHFKVPGIWFPHTVMGISTSAIISMDSDEAGPFKGQLLVGDQGHSKIMRAFLEKVNGQYQGACFPFREGFASGILRMAWGSDHSLFVGMTSRGWASTGKDLFGLQRVIFPKQFPLEIKAMRITTTGFELEFTKPVNKAIGSMTENYKMTGFTYSYHKKYGSPVINAGNCNVSKAEVSEDGRKVNLTVNGLRAGYIHELKIANIATQEGEKLLHPEAYYTINAFPEGTHHGHHEMAHTKTPPIAAGCGSDPSKSIQEQPADWKTGADMTIHMSTKPGLKFDKEILEVKAGSKVKLVFNNNDDMLHNLVITAPGKGEEVGQNAMDMGLNGTNAGYIPDSKSVLFHTCLIQPEASQTIYFTAPKAGDYPFICSFPGHSFVMKGVMKVR
ncbi:plastocyanin/azurin family copper-binding protein [Dyadobacter sp. LJ53]|uniref:plastocyanin/azurin family copper-binding protein n=1 Tax=Dyadobacter chenwenxiniae TaxID=2906456 RepID=UPI001F2696E4|nr:plastocyanin/azurin family copper-binding protein [Dyadobacter chenwenxiniae]MCF0051833.1 plastocyanin/azurin family copper-binding protein [Dyadobacter chenwenxiniae]